MNNQNKTMNISDVKLLIKGVLETPPQFWDNPNGAYEWICPFCTAVHKGEARVMDELKHDEDCPYVLAAKISAEIE